MGLGAYLVFRRGMPVQKVGPVVFAFVGIGALGLALAFLWDSWRFTQRAVLTTGEVVVLTPDASDLMSPVVRFNTAGGEQAECVGLGSNPPAYTRGQRVGVYYLPLEPTNARINAFAQLWLQCVIFFGISFVLIGIAIFTHRVTQRRSASSRVSSVLGGEAMHPQDSRHHSRFKPQRPTQTEI